MPQLRERGLLRLLLLAGSLAYVAVGGWDGRPQFERPHHRAPQPATFLELGERRAASGGAASRASAPERLPRPAQAGLAAQGTDKRVGKASSSQLHRTARRVAGNTEGHAPAAAAAHDVGSPDRLRLAGSRTRATPGSHPCTGAQADWQWDNCTGDPHIDCPCPHEGQFRDGGCEVDCEACGVGWQTILACDKPNYVDDSRCNATVSNGVCVPCGFGGLSQMDTHHDGVEDNKFCPLGQYIDTTRCDAIHRYGVCVPYCPYDYYYSATTSAEGGEGNLDSGVTVATHCSHCNDCGAGFYRAGCKGTSPGQCIRCEVDQWHVCEEHSYLHACGGFTLGMTHQCLPCVNRTWASEDPGHFPIQGCGCRSTPHECAKCATHFYMTSTAAPISDIAPINGTEAADNPTGDGSCLPCGTVDASADNCSNVMFWDVGRCSAEWANGSCKPCNNFVTISSVTDNSCTQCTGGHPVDCGQAVCEPGFTTYNGAGACAMCTSSDDLANTAECGGVR